MTAVSGNKDIHRYRVIHDCLRGKIDPQKLAWDKVDLALACDAYFQNVLGETVSIKSETIRKLDIKNMKALFNAPIEQVKSGNQVFYRYSNPHFTLNDNFFFEDWDWRALQLALRSFQSKIKNKNLQRNLEKTLGKLQDLLAFGSEQVPSFVVYENENSSHEHHDWMGMLIECVSEKRCIQLKYLRAYEDLESYLICPYLLKEYRQQWYLVGLDLKDLKLKSFSLDRINSIEDTEEAFLEIDLAELKLNFQHLIGITNPKTEIETIQLRVSKKQANYFKSHPLHWTQRIIAESEKFIDFEYRLMINFELKSLILSYSRDVVVLSPLNLVNEIKMNLKDALNRY